MSDLSWKMRLEAALETSGKSKRAVSLASGSGPGYLHSVLTEGKDPTIGKLVSICEELNVSASYILYGVNIAPEDEEIIRALADNPGLRDGVTAIIRSKLAS